jgi:site-specific recombinase XerD
MRRGISRRDIRELMDAVANRGCEREAGKRLQAIGTMFRWGLSREIVAADPTAGLKGYDPGTPRDRVLTVEEIEALWQWLESDALSLEAADILKRPAKEIIGPMKFAGKTPFPKPL